MESTEFVDVQNAHAYPDGIEDHYWNSARQSMIEDRLRQAGIPRNAAILDIGCGRGHTVCALRRAGYDAVGVDLSSPPPANRHVGRHLHLGEDCFQLPLELRQRCQVILMLDVLEHLPAPAAFLEQLSTSFPSCETLLVTVPARQELWSNYDEYYGHYLRYDARAIRELFREGSFQLMDWEYLFHGLYGPAQVLKLLGRNRNIELAAPSARSRWLHRLIRSAFLFERRIIPKWVPGTSLLAVARRRAVSVRRAA